MRHVAIVGSGPAGYYTAETLQKAEDISVDVIDRLPVPYGLIRTGVAPDHQSIKAVSRRYEGVALADNVRFVGHVSVGTDVGIDELKQLYDAVVLATGAPNDRPLGIPGADLPGVIGSAAFVGWYNGHPDFADLDPPLDSPGVAVIGNGNVALDDALLEPGMRKSVTHLRHFAANPVAKPVTIDFDFFAMPVAIEGDGRAQRVIVERTRLDADLRSHGTGETYAIEAGLVVSCIGYQTPPIPGVPYEHGRGRFANDEGRILPGLYCVGWARRGPSGTIGTNKPDGARIADMVLEDIGRGGGKAGRPGLDALLAGRGIAPVTFRDWRKIEAAEVAAALEGNPREKFVRVEAMIEAIGR